MTGSTLTLDEPSTRTRVFLSYSRGDRPRALKVIAALEASGIDVWWDGMLTVGDAFAQTTEAALETADAVVVLWSETSVQSHWVRDEATRGRDRGCMVPVSLDGAQPPLGFRQIQYIALDQWRGKPSTAEFQALVQAVQSAAAAPGTKELRSSSVKPAAIRIGRRQALIIGAGSVAALGGLALWRGGFAGGGAGRSVNSIAILPFRNVGGDPAQRYFSDGLAEELRTTLSRNRLLDVAAETSTNRLSEAGKQPQEISAALHVGHVLDGSVRRGGDMLRITARLIDGASGFEKWAQSFDRKIDDVLAVQSEIANYVADALAARVGANNDTGRTRNAKAFDAYLRGRALLKQAASEKTDRGALAAFDDAISRDPQFALAYAARASALAIIASTYASGKELVALQQHAFEAAQRAVKLAPDMAEGQAALGYVLANVRLDHRGAELPFQRAYELGFGNADLLTAYGEFATNTGRFGDATAAIDRALRLDPLNPSVLRSAALLAFYARDLAKAETAFSAALTLNVDGGVIHRKLGDLYLIQGRIEQAQAQYLLEPLEILRLPGLAIVEMKLAGVAAGEARLIEMTRRFGTNCFYQQLEIFSQWGRIGPALDALDKAMAVRDSGLAELRNDPLLDPLRAQPRFAAARNELGFS